jgi:CheY-like chemotaxis protein
MAITGMSSRPSSWVRARTQELGLDDIPVIAISAGSQTEVPTGASAFLRKPFDVDGLMELVRHYTGRPPTPRAQAAPAMLRTA